MTRCRSRAPSWSALPSAVVWGTDFPHPMLKMPPDNVALVDLVPLIAQDPSVRQKLLVDNPARLYGFDWDAMPDRTGAESGIDGRPGDDE